MSWFIVDIEADGPVPGLYSMIELGAVLVKPGLDTTFHGYLRPISDKWVPEALAVSGYSREQTLDFEYPSQVMFALNKWVKENSVGYPRLISDNNMFDGMFLAYYFHCFIGENPFGFSSSRIGDLYRGESRNIKAGFKHLRKTKHDHNPVHDALGNAEALLEINRRFELGMIFK